MKIIPKIIYVTIQGITYMLSRVPPQLKNIKLKSIFLVADQTLESISEEIIPVVILAEVLTEWGEYLICKLEDNEQPIKYIDLICVVVEKPYCIIYIDGRRYAKYKGSLINFEKLLPPEDFFMIKHNCIVSKYHIILVDKGDSGYVHSTGNNNNLISREIKPSLNKWLKGKKPTLKDI